MMTNAPKAQTILEEKAKQRIEIMWKTNGDPMIIKEKMEQLAYIRNLKDLEKQINKAKEILNDGKDIELVI